MTQVPTLVKTTRPDRLIRQAPLLEAASMLKVTGFRERPPRAVTW
jgi:hypothetical protein